MWKAITASSEVFLYLFDIQWYMLAFSLVTLGQKSRPYLDESLDPVAINGLIYSFMPVGYQFILSLSKDAFNCKPLLLGCVLNQVVSMHIPLLLWIVG